MIIDVHLKPWLKIFIVEFFKWAQIGNNKIVHNNTVDKLYNGMMEYHAEMKRNKQQAPETFLIIH
jgi:hypothetical protein